MSLEIDFPKPKIDSRPFHSDIYKYGGEYLLKEAYYANKQTVLRFIRKHKAGDIFTLSAYNEVICYLGYTFDGKVIFSYITDGRWNVSCVRSHSLWDWPWPRKNSHITIDKTPEQIENLLGQYCAKLKRHRRKLFVTTLSDPNSGIDI